MEIQVKAVPRMTLEEFANQHRLVMVVTERGSWTGIPPGSPRRWCAHFRDVDLYDGHFIRGASGEGSTPEAAIAAYVHEISEKTIVLHGNTSVEVPLLTGVR